MKKFFAFLIIIPFILMTACSSNEEDASFRIKRDGEPKQAEPKHNRQKKEEKAIPNLENYETLTLEKQDEGRDITIEYPHFNYEPVDTLIEKEMKAQFENQLELADELMESEYEDGIEKFHFYRLEFEEPAIAKHFISIHFTGGISMGSASGQAIDLSFNYDLQNDKLLTLEDIFKNYQTNLLVISEHVAEALLNDTQFSQYRDPLSDDYVRSVKEETQPSFENYGSFTLGEDGITFYKQYYSLFPNAEGIVGITVDWDDLNGAKQSSDGTEYTNKAYDFSITIPKSWEGKYKIKKGNWNPAAIASVDFQFVNKGKEIGNIFSINVYDKNDDVESPMETIIAKNNDYIFTYNTIAELPPEFYEGGELYDLQEDYLQMINEETPALMKNFILQ